MKKAGVFILLVSVLAVMCESCGSSYEVCPAYGGQIQKESQPTL
ncbi:MAG: hypothetical protein ACO3E1_08405 [Flavobacteriales bacterium]